MLGNDNYPLAVIRGKSQGYCRRIKESVKPSIFTYSRKTIFFLLVMILMCHVPFPLQGVSQDEVLAADSDED